MNKTSRENSSLQIDLAGITMNNPVMTASGTFGYGEEYGKIIDITKLGAIIVKAITREPRIGNPYPRVVETAAGMLSSCGLQNIGIENFLTEKMFYLQQIGIPIIVNIAGESIEDFAYLAQKLSHTEGISALEMNVSCPNVKNGGMIFGRDSDTVYRLVKEVKAVSKVPVICKLTPNVTDIVAIALAAQEGGADVISLINALWGLAIDVEKQRPILGNITGGLTGPAIKPVALRMVWQVAQAVSVPVIGIGGITTARDALEFIIAGATAIQVGTANFYKPRATLEIIEGIEEYLIEHNYDSVTQLRGALRLE